MNHYRFMTRLVAAATPTQTLPVRCCDGGQQGPADRKPDSVVGLSVNMWCVEYSRMNEAVFVSWQSDCCGGGAEGAIRGESVMEGGNSTGSSVA